MASSPSQNGMRERASLRDRLEDALVAAWQQQRSRLNPAHNQLRPYCKPNAVQQCGWQKRNNRSGCAASHVQ